MRMTSYLRQLTAVPSTLSPSVYCMAMLMCNEGQLCVSSTVSHMGRSIRLHFLCAAAASPHSFVPP